MPSPDGSMFAWAPIPPRFAHLGSVEFSKLLLARAQVAVAPGIGFGEHGDGHVRIALVENTHRLRQALRNIRGFLHTDEQRWPSRAADRRAAHDRASPHRCIAGLGTVGGGVLTLLRENADIVAARAGRPIAVTAVSARDRTRDRGVPLAGSALVSTTRWRWPPIPRSMWWWR